MKLYATVTSERASKGQGGNKEIEIKLQAGAVERKQVARISFIPSPHIKDRYELRIYDDKGMSYFQYDLTKGEKEKGEALPHKHTQECEWICTESKDYGKQRLA